MNTTTDNIITNRDELQHDLIKNILDDMDLKTMEALLYDMLNETYDKYSMDELIEEVEGYYPELLEEDPLAIFKPMNFRIVEIDFDFDDSTGLFPIEDQQEIVDEVMGTVWDAADEDDLIEEITSATGWCINSIDYRHILS